MPAPATPRQALLVAEPRDAAVLVDVLVLSTDVPLFDAIRGAIGERNPVWRARTAEESVDLLLTGRCGVLLVDMAAVSTNPTTLIAQIVEQFPDVIVVVAGRREDEALLAHLITEGLVYRFMHKPLTAKRAGMFLQAAIRRHVEQRESQVNQALLPIPRVLPGRFDPGKWLFVAAGVAMFVAALVLLAGGRPPRGQDAEGAATQIVTPAVVSTAPQADPVLSRARAAFAAGRFEAPAGRNALDLYAAVLLSRPDLPEARTGLDSTIDRIVSVARLAAADGNLPEARRLLSRVEAVAPSSLAVQRLAMYLAPQSPPSGTDTPEALAAASSAAAVVATAPAPLPAPLPAAPRRDVQSSPSAGQATARQQPLTGQAADRAATPQALHPRPVVTPVVVTPDPLAPRVANADELRSTASRSSRVATRTFGAPISSGLPTAGYVKAPRPEPAPVEKPGTSLDPATTAALAMPTDELGRIHATDPVYPADALRNHVEGWVELSFTITETGSVRDVEVVDSQPHGVFDTAATEAVEGWRFRPRLANGQPVAHRSYVTLRFNVEG
ncbi:MAG TPA: energy transducer TonB [Steroidobacteraceae bacterium]|nr:energy transducer TonB [Steroidobacteraceae bacterium]